MFTLPWQKLLQSRTITLEPSNSKDTSLNALHKSHQTPTKAIKTRLYSKIDSNPNSMFALL